MPNINIMHWNIERFGYDVNDYGLDVDYENRCNFIAHTALNVQADVICITELMDYKAAGVTNQLKTLQTQLNLVFNQSDGSNGNWYYDHIGGSLDKTEVTMDVDFNRNDEQRFSTSDELKFQGEAEKGEGYAVFWNQNLAKFTMDRPPKVRDFNLNDRTLGANWVTNTQSFGVRIYQKDEGATNYQDNHELTENVEFPGTLFLTCTLPVGTRTPLNTPIRNGTGVAVFPANQTTDTTLALESKYTIPEGTQIGAAGITLEYVDGDGDAYTVIIVPGHYTLTNDFKIPDESEIFIPKHCLSLVMEGRRTTPTTFHDTRRHPDTSRYTSMENYWHVRNADSSNSGNWTQLPFTANGFKERNGVYEAAILPTRRPAFCTLNINDGNSTRFPVIMFHTPNSSSRDHGNRVASYSRPLYQAYDHGKDPNTEDPYVDSPGMIGGDFNMNLYHPGTNTIFIFVNGDKDVDYAPGAPLTKASYENTTDNFARPGANCNILLENSYASLKEIDDGDDEPIKEFTTSLSSLYNLITNLSLDQESTIYYRSFQNDNVCYPSGLTPNPFYKFAYGGIDYGYVYDLPLAVVDFQESYSALPNPTEAQMFRPLVGSVGSADDQLYFKANFPQIPIETIRLYHRIDSDEDFDAVGNPNPIGLLYDRYFHSRSNVALEDNDKLVDLSAAAQAANFIKRYISDHLPVIAPMQFTTPAAAQHRYDLSKVTLTATATEVSLGSTISIALTLKDNANTTVINPYVTVVLSTVDRGEFQNNIPDNPKKGIAFWDGNNNQYSTTFTATQTDGVGMTTINATINNQKIQNTLNITVVTAADAQASSFFSADNQLTTGSSTTLAVRLRDTGNILHNYNASDVVTFELVTLNAGTITTDGTYDTITRIYWGTYTAPNTVPPNTVQIRAKVNGVQIGDLLTLTIT